MCDKITIDNVHTTGLYQDMKLADPTAYYFQDFLKYLVRVHDFNAEAIIDVMYYSHKYIPKFYNDFLVSHCLAVYGEPENLTF